MSEKLAENLLLLAYDMRGRCRIDPVAVDLAAAGAMLADRRLAGRVVLDGPHVVVAGAVGDDHVLESIAGERRPPRDWVLRLAAFGVRDRLLTDLAAQGRVSIERHRFGTVRYPVRDLVALWSAQELAVSAALDPTADERGRSLAALVAAAGLGKAVFSSAGNWRVLRDRVRAAASDDWPAQAVRETIKTPATSAV